MSFHFDHDQAAVLRRWASDAPAHCPVEINQHWSGRTLAVSGGKGGVGKSNISLNLALGLGDADHRVLLMDTDFGLPNLDVLLGQAPSHSLTDVIRNQCTFSEATFPVTPNVTLMPGGDIWSDQSPNLAEIRELLTQLAIYLGRTDYLIIDTQAGISNAVMGFLLSAENVLMVTTPEPPALMDTYRTIKRLWSHQPKGRISLIVNRAKEAEARRVYRSLGKMSERFLGRYLDLSGWIPEDRAVTNAVKRQQPFLLLHPQCPASQGIYRLVGKITGSAANTQPKPRSFLERLSTHFLGLRKGGDHDH